MSYDEHNLVVEKFHDQVIMPAEAIDIGILPSAMTVKRLYQVRQNVAASVITEG